MSELNTLKKRQKNWISGRKRDMCSGLKKREKILSPISFEVGINDPYKKRKKGGFTGERETYGGL